LSDAKRPVRPILFTVLDKDGVPVTMTQDTWYDKLLHPVIGHPEVEPYLEEIKRAIQEREFVYQSTKNELCFSIDRAQRKANLHIVLFWRWSNRLRRKARSTAM